MMLHQLVNKELEFMLLPFCCIVSCHLGDSKYDCCFHVPAGCIFMPGALHSVQVKPRYRKTVLVIVGVQPNACLSTADIGRWINPECHAVSCLRVPCLFGD